jgi:hypothetical protein
MSYGEYTERIEINCPRDCGKAVEVEVEVSWDTAVGYNNVAWLSGPEDCCGGLTEDEKTEVREEAEEHAREGRYA